MTVKIKKILVPTDGSDGAKHAGAYAGVLASALGAEITVLAVNDDKVLALNTLVPESILENATIPAVTVQKIKEATETNVRDHTLAETVQAIGTGIKLEVVQQWGHTAETICNFAEENGFDLIVIGSRGLSTFSRVLLGSVSSQIVHHSKCPVTVVR